MNIAFNALSAQTGGGMSMIKNIMPHIRHLDSKNQYFIFYSLRRQGFTDAIPTQFKKIPVRYLPGNPFVRVLWEQFVFPWYLLRHKIHLLYSVGNTTSMLAPCKVVLMMENANPYSKLELPWSYKERIRLKLLRILGWLSARRAVKIRFVSKNSRDLIVPQLGVDPKKCVVIPHGVLMSGGQSSAAAEDCPPDIAGKNYLLTIGANGPHRNTERLLKAFSILITQHEYEGDLVVVGNTGSAHYTATLEKMVDELGISGRVRFEGEVPHSEIITYFNKAELFVFPSLEETFGISLLEAMRFEVPIAAADCNLDLAHHEECFNPFREICAEATAYFNPFDPKDMAKCIKRILLDTILRAQLVALGKERVKKYNLEDTARALVQLFDTIVSPP